jgi:hypothetical protein
MIRAHCPRCHQDIISFTPVELCPFCGASLDQNASAAEERSPDEAQGASAWEEPAPSESVTEDTGNGEVVEPTPFGTTLEFPDGLSARGELWAVEGGQAVVLELSTQSHSLEGRAFHFVIFDEDRRELLSRAVEFAELVPWQDDGGHQGYRYLLFKASDDFAAHLGGWTLVCDWDGP